MLPKRARMRRLLRAALGHLTKGFAECSDGADAVATFERERPDWTIMDIAMEGMDGLEATRRIKARFPEARILVLTQYQSPGIERAAHEAGAAAFLTKDQITQIAHVLATFGADRPDSQTTHRDTL